MRTRSRSAAKFNILFFLMLVAPLWGCGGASQSSMPKTDLGPQGNSRVARTFTAYAQRTQTCLATGTATRVLVTGFGLFAGAPFNISSVVVGSLADERFTPRVLDPRTPFTPAASPASGMVGEDEMGAHVVNRSMVIAGHRYDICFLTLEVQWDLAAAIIVTEAQRWHPAMILMTGRGGRAAEFEGGAYNQALAMSGFNTNGSIAPEVTPVVVGAGGATTTQIIPAAPAQLNMSWDAPRLAHATQALINDLGFATLVHTAARAENNYICNNVSYIVLAAARHIPLTLAGAQLKIDAALVPSTKIGFFHFPAGADNAPRSIAVWVRSLATMIDAQLGAT